MNSLPFRSFMFLCFTGWNDISWWKNTDHLNADAAFIIQHSTISHVPGFVASNRKIFPSQIITAVSSSSSPDEIPTYNGPIFTSCDDDDTMLPVVMKGIIELSELGIDIAIGPSMIIPGQLGLYCRCIDTVDSVTLPECTLLCGYAKPGRFLDADVGDKTVGFSLQSGTTAVFFERKLMTVQDALTKAATEFGDGSCGLEGHELSMTNQDEPIVLQPIADGFHRYYCPDEYISEPIPVQNYGQYCNDLAWKQLSPPSSNEEYMARSKIHNCVQLVWRLEYDATSQQLIPSWPVSVLSHDVRFENHEFMELGTRYGWNYWQAVVQLEDLA